MSTIDVNTFTGSTRLNIVTIVVLINLATILGGFGSMWGVQTTRMDDGFKVLGDRYAEIKAEQASLAARIERTNEDRVTLSGRLVGLEADTKYISQSISELKLVLRGR